MLYKDLLSGIQSENDAEHNVMRGALSVIPIG